MAPVSAYWMYIKTATYRSNSFSCGFIETLPCGVLIADHFFSHTQCPGAVHGFWSFYYGGKGPYLGVFPILQYKRPQGEEGFFLGISNLGWFDFSEVSCTRGHENRSKLKHLIFVKFAYPGSWNLEKIEAFDFCDVSCTRGHENWRKLKYLILVKFCVPGVMKTGKN